MRTFWLSCVVFCVRCGQAKSICWPCNSGLEHTICPYVHVRLLSCITFEPLPTLHSFGTTLTCMATLFLIAACGPTDYYTGLSGNLCKPCPSGCLNGSGSGSCTPADQLGLTMDCTGCAPGWGNVRSTFGVYGPGSPASCTRESPTCSNGRVISPNSSPILTVDDHARVRKGTHAACMVLMVYGGNFP